jgi:hypothetical protein
MNARRLKGPHHPIYADALRISDVIGAEASLLMGQKSYDAAGRGTAAAPEVAERSKALIEHLDRLLKKLPTTSACGADGGGPSAARSRSNCAHAARGASRPVSQWRRRGPRAPIASCSRKQIIITASTSALISSAMARTDRDRHRGEHQQMDERTLGPRSWCDVGSAWQRQSANPAASESGRTKFIRTLRVTSACMPRGAGPRWSRAERALSAKGRSGPVILLTIRSAAWRS